jgi:hypothetical protein
VDALSQNLRVAADPAPGEIVSFAIKYIPTLLHLQLDRNNVLYIGCDRQKGIRVLPAIALSPFCRTALGRGRV